MNGARDDSGRGLLVRARMCRATLSALCVLFILTTGSAEDEPAPPDPQFRTTLRGTEPAGLEGRWLTVAYIELPRTVRTVPAVWEFRRAQGQLQHAIRFVQLPEAIEAAVRAANKAGTKWEPAGADLAAITAAWDTLVPRRLGTPASVETEIASPDGFDADVKADPRAQSAIWVVREVFDFAPQAAQAQPVRQTNLFAALAAREEGYSGNYATAVLATAPFPAPFNLTGSFSMYRLGAAPGNLLSRLVEIFRGCGR